MSARGDSAPVVGRGPAVTSRDLRMVLWFAVAYGVAAYLGRVPDEAGVSVVWPAAGVSVLWLVARAGRPWRWVDPALIAVVTVAVSYGSAMPLAQAAMSGIAASLQAVVCAVVVARRIRRVWLARGGQALRLNEFVWFVAAALCGALASAPVIALAGTLNGAGMPGEDAILWCVRNTVSVLVLGSAGLVVGEAVRRRRWRPDGGPGQRPSSTAERVACLLSTPILYVAWFAWVDERAVAFLLLTLTVWAGTRLPSRLVVVHVLLVSIVVVAQTTLGAGPFVQSPTLTQSVAVAHVYVGLVCILGLGLSLAGEERSRLVAALTVASDGTTAQAGLLTAILETMSEGVQAVDIDGQVLIRNPSARRLLTGTTNTAQGHGLDAGAQLADLADLRTLDGSPVTDDRILYGGAPRGDGGGALDLLVQPPGTTEPRVVAFTTTRIPDAYGGGAVTVMRDVTAERQELRRAALVQASLLPTRPPNLPGYDLAAQVVPAGSVGGDFYDWQEVAGGVVVTLADVMGKGTGAAILAATTRSVLRSQQEDDDVVATVIAAERALSEDLANSGAFVTIVRTRLHASSGRLTHADAGHGLSFLIRADGTTDRLVATGLPLGIAVDVPRTARHAVLAPGDVLLILSDGVLDAAGGSIADLRPLEPVVRSATSATEVVERVLKAVAAQGTQEDDLTVVALRREPTARR
ncbi:SpoIIE family protein phosphatase [Antribacter sp. KLBMP9083]|uniref:SpoIIE family protein phosphatase n=1 Tax=Antribacter soli TaxID=2910976 RepID=A0AA41U790_9MICO|nr:SpoIIE family protein phosphatase [Antribacter soli]MCF4121095.1 SpoIIE family protein phosphatase [Antribacter soli]